MRTSSILLVLLSIALAAGMLVASLWQVGAPFKGFTRSRVIVEIPPGHTARGAAKALHDAGVIRSPLAFRILLRLRGAEAAIQAGEYEFAGTSSLSQVLDRILRGDVVRHRLTVPEGLRAGEIAELVESLGFGSRGGFLDAVRQVALVADFDPIAEDLEGYLFPDTYFFPRTITEAQIVAEMVRGLRSVLTPERREQISALGMSVREAVTLASLIEEEAQIDEERDRISAVFHNRLKKGMLLQCDPTVVYALVRADKYRGRIFRSDLEYRSPYNTYVRPGLPPGPISNPGLRSLDASLNPADTDDLFFVVNGPGRHEFSTNVSDHERAVERYRREQRVKLSGAPR